MSLHERIVYDSTDECPYLEGEISRTPLRWQVTPPSLEDFDVSLSEGDRRVGRMLYRTDCPSCNACEPIRVPVHLFKRISFNAGCSRCGWMSKKPIIRIRGISF